jgi:site-specific DNA-methyltransferase (adenine-specific)
VTSPRIRNKGLRLVRVADIEDNPLNFRTHPEAQRAAFAGIETELGFYGYPDVYETEAGTIRLIDGQLRKEHLLSKYGPDATIEVNMTDFDEAEANKALLTHDPISAMAEADKVRLDQLLREVDTGDEALQQMMTDLADEAGLYQDDSNATEIEEDEVPEPPVDPITKPGDLWILGEHRLLCGDSTKAGDVERLMAGEKADTVVTDPPYGMAFKSNYRKVQHEAIIGDADEEMIIHATGIEATHSRYIWCRWDNIPKAPKPKSVITWVKNNWSMGDLEHEHARQTEACLFYAGAKHRWAGKRPTDVVNHARTGNDLHPTQKPVSLMVEVVEWTVGLIYDPFLGSGTTLIAAEQLGRKCYGMEISPQYCDVIVKRWENLTGKKAVLEESH